jgi:hypothetical protein
MTDTRPETLAETLDRLGSARNARDWLAAEVKRLEAPHKAAAEAASARFRELLTSAEATAEAANDSARELYAAAVEARRAELLAGHEAPGVPLPTGWSVQQRTAVEISDPMAIPRGLCTPDKKAIAAALKAGAVPGAALVPSFVFIRAEEKG